MTQERLVDVLGEVVGELLHIAEVGIAEVGIGLEDIVEVGIGLGDIGLGDIGRAFDRVAFVVGSSC